MKIYTKQGDSGETSLLGGIKTEKDSTMIEAIGTLDELNAAIGVVRTLPGSPKMNQILLQIQKDLFEVSSNLLSIGTSNLASNLSSNRTSNLISNRTSKGPRSLGQEKIDALEQEIDDISSQLPQIAEFIISGDNTVSAQLHFVRTICRRAERRTISALKSVNAPLLNQPVLAYLNRLSDLLFILARKNS
ncbi:MAG: cob(I)yrinic acid a,c-diamide adenosyltransferase [Thermoguttaceae bacterium]